MKTIWKFLLDADAPKQILMLPTDAEILCIKLVASETVCHVLMDPHALLVNRTICTFGTGWEIKQSENLHYIDTVVYRDGVLILHFFEDRQP
jgi:hypothetical protein